jgi:hypothetical protein
VLARTLSAIRADRHARRSLLVVAALVAVAVALPDSPFWPQAAVTCDVVNLAKPPSVESVSCTLVAQTLKRHVLRLEGTVCDRGAGACVCVFRARRGAG